MGEAPRTRRVGRLQQVAYDATPLSTLAPDLDARLGWLLAMSRLYPPHDGYADGSAFVAEASARGLSVSRSLVSRWESGDIPVSFEGLAAYEAMLELKQGCLTALAGYVRRALPSRGPVRPMLDPGERAFARQLDELVDRAEDGLATSRDWQQLGWHFAAVPLVHLRQDTWRTLTRRLVAASARSVGRAQLMVHNAVGDLACVSRAPGFLLHAIAGILDDPDAQVVTAPFSLLERIPDPRAADMVLDVFEDPRTPPLIMLSVSMVTQMVTRGDLTADQRARLGMQVLRHWRSDPERAAKRLAELIAVLPEGLRAPLTDAADRSGQDTLSYAVQHGESRADAADRLSRELAEGARGRTPGHPSHAQDRMLPRLVRETLFHRHQERRHLATLFLAASPFASGVCDELLMLLADDERSADVRLTAAWAIRYLARDGHRMRMIRLLDHTDELVAAPVTLALGHIGFDEVSDQVLRSKLGGPLTNQTRATMYALGMTGSPGLAGMARSPAVPEWQRRAAAWWETHGPAVHD